MKRWQSLALVAMTAGMGCASLTEVQKAERDLEAAQSELALVNADRDRIKAEIALIPSSSPDEISLKHRAILVDKKLAMVRKSVTAAESRLSKARAVETTIRQSPTKPDEGNVPPPPTIPTPGEPIPIPTPPEPTPTPPEPAPTPPEPTPTPPEPTPTPPAPTPTPPAPTPTPPEPAPTPPAPTPVPPVINGDGQPAPLPPNTSGLPGTPSIPGLQLSALNVKINNDCNFEYSVVEAELQNTTTATFEDIQLAFQLFDANGKKVDTAKFEAKTIAPGANLKVQAVADAITNTGIRAQLIDIKAARQ